MVNSLRMLLVERPAWGFRCAGRHFACLIPPDGKRSGAKRIARRLEQPIGRPQHMRQRCGAGSTSYPITVTRLPQILERVGRKMQQATVPFARRKLEITDVNRAYLAADS